MTRQRGTVFAIVACASFLLQIKWLEGKQCTASIPTLNNVAQCPNTAEAWLNAASRKRCDAIAETQTCVSDPAKFVYHCLVNQWLNGTVEVCAPNWILTGYCGYYDTVIGKIVNDVKKDCTLFNEPCPTRYNSSEAYKYQECYRVTKNRNGCGIERDCKSSEESYLKWMIVAFLLAVVFLVACIITCWKSKKYKYEVRENSHNGIQYQREEEVTINNGTPNGPDHVDRVEAFCQDPEISDGLGELLIGREIDYHGNLPRQTCGSGSSSVIHSDLLDTATSDALDTDKEDRSLSTSLPGVQETRNTRRKRRRKKKNKHHIDDFRVKGSGKTK
ncbi:uncharacterized protein LOC125674591 isoform X2 [Ostrea edulis]|uniref:uncharacterized protein LOC125674591 isoform X2 n=1 Tax=Ostrea edulis TaxID=37623 RepID=UPI0024AE9381|nr:uncharacterized protein LOC125674591 isoform X2 [Ostrea edulis]XP_056015863.1 uncharacterized protein LOC125674591 isoform X2 [Ostrea edulis]